MHLTPCLERSYAGACKANACCPNIVHAVPCCAMLPCRIREPVHDMNCLLCWGRDTLVITFRGTQSLANVKADAKVWSALLACCRLPYVMHAACVQTAYSRSLTGIPFGPSLCLSLPGVAVAAPTGARQAVAG